MPLIGIIAAFFEPIFHGWANILDNYFANRIFPRLSIILMFGAVINILLLPVIFLLDAPVMLSAPLLGVVFVITLIELFYLFPYYWSLRESDTSVVASLFLIGKVTVPILAFFLVGERLALIQYVGFVLIILSAIFLTLDIRKLKLNRAFFLMAGVSLVLAVQTILYKYVFEAGATWGSVATANTVLQFFICIAIMLFTYRKLTEFHEDLQTTIKNAWLLLVAQLLAWGGEMGASFAVSILPVSVAQGIGSTQPLFVLAYAVLFGRMFPSIFKEYLGRDGIMKKVLLILLMIAGAVLVATQGSSLE